MAIGAIIMMIVTSPKLAALCLIGVPLVVLPIILFGRRVRRLSRESQDRIADTSAYAGEALNAMRRCRPSPTRRPTARFHRAVEDSFAAAIRRTRMRAVMTAFVIFLVGSCIVGVLWAGASDVLAGRMTGGELSQFVLYAMLLASGVGALSETWGDVQRAAGATERLMEILATEPVVKPPPNPVPLPQAREGRGPLRAGQLPLPVAARPPGAARRVASRSSREKRSRWSARRARANRPCSRCCCASSIRRRGASCSTA